jgi:hypothetical protein
MQRGAVICLLAAASVAFGHAAPVPTTWLGSWAASDGESLDISAAANRLQITINSQAKLVLNLDGSETISPEGPKLSFHRIDDRTFDVTLRVNDKTFGNQIENIRYVLSADGNSLRETRPRASRVFQKLLFIPLAGQTFLRPIERRW